MCTRSETVAAANEGIYTSGDTKGKRREVGTSLETKLVRRENAKSARDITGTMVLN